MNIIQIRNQDIHAADEAFAEFMSLTENHLNEKTRGDFSLYKKCNGTDLEKVALEALHEIAPATPFQKENIKLVSGAKFPDIIAEKYYGVEVKSTKEDSWKSTGSSIVENTRVEDVARIYMLFGKLGGERAEFKCLPYQDCLSNIAITHSPRYLIDMELMQNNAQTIFDKIGTEYDEFRQLDERSKVAMVRNYYKERAKQQGKVQMPWWMGEDTPSAPVLSLYSDMTIHEKRDIVARMFVLFPEDVLNGNYNRAALWLCNRYSVIDLHLRDSFSAGGKIESVGKVHLPHKMPKVLEKLYKVRHIIFSLLAVPDSNLVADINFFWDKSNCPKSYREQWIEKVFNAFKMHKELRGVNRKLFGEIMS